MRTTVDVPDLLLKRAKRVAAERDTSLSAIVAEALSAYLRRDAPSDEAPFVLVEGGRPGAPMPTPDAIEAALDSEEREALALGRGGRRAAS